MRKLFFQVVRILWQEMALSLYTQMFLYERLYIYGWDWKWSMFFFLDLFSERVNVFAVYILNQVWQGFVYSEK